MRQTRSVTRKLREAQRESLTADSNDQAGGSSAQNGSLPRGQEAGNLSAINIGGPDIATFGSLEEFLNQAPQSQEQQEQQQQQQQEELQPVLYDPLNQPYLPWDCPGSDQHLYPSPAPAMADDQSYLSPSYFVEPNFFASDFTQEQYQYQFDDYQALQPWVPPSLEEAAILDVQGMQGHVGELYEPLPFGYAMMPDYLVQDPLLDERWAATYEGDLFGHSQALDTVQSEAVPLDENAQFNLPVASPAQSVTEIAPTAQEPQQPLPAGTKADVERARRRRLAGRRRKGPKPVMEVDWLPHGADRETKNRFLLEARRYEVSYKMIKMYGRFKEAESTLRGRYRTLTKRREDRVRNPKWTPIDIQLLKEAVQVYAGSEHPDRAGISWMMVSQYIKSHGGTYSFGYNTSHRKWLHLERTGQLGDNVFDQSWEDHDDDENVDVDVDDENEDADVDDENEDADVDDENEDADVDDEMEGVDTDLHEEPKDEDGDEDEDHGHSDFHLWM
ncbi:uncharacterized protein TrAtP1_004993 [Trichoderma atroviride]|uniref:uncharacterized protein n=1 Tax=Hypocrea atroviridis TaxID=63577 RepID=UPI00332BD5EB|nr:hypothetical protein TrAtP1_004993 [Trichoderma atroviride]